MIERTGTYDALDLMEEADRISSELAVLRRRIEMRVQRRQSSGTIPVRISRADTEPSLPAAASAPPPAPLRPAVFDPHAGRYSFVRDRKKTA